MKHGKKPTRNQCKFIKSNFPRLNVENWLVVKDTTEVMLLEHRNTGNVRSIKKL